MQQLSVDGNSLSRVPVFIYLGILLDEELKFEPALNDLYAKVSFRLYTLSCIRKDITKNTAVAIVKAMILPCLYYFSFYGGYSENHDYA